jgi:hypothetical protein
MKTRLLAIVGLLCVLGSPLAASAGSEPPTMSSGTPEFYISFLTGYANTSSADATFTDGSGASHGVSDIIKDVDYRKNFSVGGNLGVWFPTRDKLAGLDLGAALTGFLWQADVAWGQENFNGQTDSQGVFQGTTTETQGLFIGPEFLIRYPMAISENYPNGRWHPYVGMAVGMHQMAMRPGGFHGISFFNAGPGGALNTNPIPDQRDTTIGWGPVGGVKAHLFKYLAAFAEARYLMAHHDGLTSDRFNASTINATGDALVVNQYSSSIHTILVHVGLSLHFDIRP